jgi:hypothetical protein
MSHERRVRSRPDQSQEQLSHCPPLAGLIADCPLVSALTLSPLRNVLDLDASCPRWRWLLWEVEKAMIEDRYRRDSKTAERLGQTQIAVHGAVEHRAN